MGHVVRIDGVKVVRFLAIDFVVARKVTNAVTVDKSVARDCI